MRTEIHDVPFEYRVHGVKKGSRRASDWSVRDAAPAEIAFYETSEIETVSVSRTKAAIVGSRLFLPAGHEGRDGLADLRASALTTAGDPELFVANPFAIPNLDYHPTTEDRRVAAFAGTVFRATSFDDRERRLALVPRYAADIAVIGGRVHTASYALALCPTHPVFLSRHHWREASWDGRIRLPVPLRDAHAVQACGVPNMWPRSADETLDMLPADVVLDFPAIEWHCVGLAKQLAQSLIPLHGATALVGSGAFFLPDLPETLDEALFSMRRSIRMLLSDMRYGEDTSRSLEAVTASFDAVADGLRRCVADGARMPKGTEAVEELCIHAGGVRSWWNRVEAPRRSLGIAHAGPSTEDMEAVAAIAP